MKSGDENSEGEAALNKPTDQNPLPPEPPKQDYIHVRARRGQATDSHSLAERVSSFLNITCLSVICFRFPTFSFIVSHLY